MKVRIIEEEISGYLPSLSSRLLGLIDDGICLVDKTGREIFANQAYRNFLIANAESEFPDKFVWPWEDAAKFEDIRDSLDGKIPAIHLPSFYVCRLKSPGGDYRDYAVFRKYWHDMNYNADGLLYLITLETDAQKVIDRFKVIQEYISASTSDLSYSNTTMQTLVEKSLCGILIVSRKQIHFVNEAFEQITGYTKEDVLHMAPWDMVHPDVHDKIREMGLERFKGKNITDYYQTPWIHKDGHKIWMEVRAVLLHGTNPPKILANVIDISERRKAEEALEKREAELRSQSRRLEETNTALKVLLGQRNDEMEELKNNILFNIEKLVMPYIAELEAFSTNIRHKDYVQIIKENLREIISPHVRKLSSDYASLTSKQIEVVNLVKQGKTTKDIAELLCLSKAAIDFHRHNIRRKLNLIQKKVNLRTFLDIAEQKDRKS